MIVGSLFSGAGLLDAGLHQAGHGHAWFVEREPDRRWLLERRWPGVPVHDDVRTVGAHNLASVDCVAGGFPCRGVSSAGKRTGLAHPETALWAEFARIVGELGPRYVAIENVAAIRGIHDGAVWGTVVGDLAALGYDVAWGCVRASDVGAPHGRDRIFAIARHAEGAGRQGARSGREALGGARPAGDGALADAERDLAELRRGTGDVGEAPGGGREARQQRAGRTVADRAEDAPDADERGREAEQELDGWAAQDSADRHPRGGHADRHSDEVGAGVAVEWGEYEPAIRRWEAVHRPAPEPLIRRMDDGDAKLRRMRARLDRQRLSALGDGVHVYVARLLGEALMELECADDDQ